MVKTNKIDIEQIIEETISSKKLKEAVAAMAVEKKLTNDIETIKKAINEYVEQKQYLKAIELAKKNGLLKSVNVKEAYTEQIDVYLEGRNFEKATKLASESKDKNLIEKVGNEYIKFDIEHGHFKQAAESERKKGNIGKSNGLYKKQSKEYLKFGLYELAFEYAKKIGDTTLQLNICEEALAKCSEIGIGTEREKDLILWIDRAAQVSIKTGNKEKARAYKSLNEVLI